MRGAVGADEVTPGVAEFPVNDEFALALRAGRPEDSFHQSLRIGSVSGELPGPGSHAGRGTARHALMATPARPAAAVRRSKSACQKSASVSPSARSLRSPGALPAPTTATSPEDSVPSPSMVCILMYTAASDKR